VKKIFRDLKNTFVTHWAVGSDRATGREYLTSTLFALIVLTVSIEYTLYSSLGDLYWSTDTSLIATPRQAMYFVITTTGEFSGSLGFLIISYFYISIPLICLTWRRLHDFGRSGWNVLWIMLVEIIPYGTWLVILFMFLKKGDSGENKYGFPVNYDVSQNNSEEE
tara:strand:- start:147 stop:641 length:495 start_codon:yes stop_codon:yes gene_type:complete